jgi:hypothetical protein
MTNIAQGMLRTLNEHKEIHGSMKFAELLNTRSGMIISNGLMLSRLGLIDMQCNVEWTCGRGHIKYIFRDCGALRVRK